MMTDGNPGKDSIRISVKPGEMVVPGRLLKAGYGAPHQRERKRLLARFFGKS